MKNRGKVTVTVAFDPQDGRPPVEALNYSVDPDGEGIRIKADPRFIDVVPSALLAAANDVKESLMPHTPSDDATPKH